MSDSATADATDRKPSAGPASTTEPRAEGQRNLLWDLLGLDERPAPRWWPVIAALVLAPLALAPVLWRLIIDPGVTMMDTNDFEFHIRFAVEETEFFPPRISAPYPMFHVAVHALDQVIGSARGALSVMMASVTLTVAALVAIGRSPMPGRERLDPTWSAGFAVMWLLAESPTVLYEWWSGADAPYAILHFWGSPTEVVFVPFALVMALVLGDLIERPRRYLDSRPAVLGVWVLVVLTGLAKPSLGVVFAPAALLLVWVWPNWRASARAVIVLFVAPAVVVAVAQTAFLMFGPVPTGQSGFEIAPFEVFGQIAGAGGPAFWLLPLAILALVPALRGRLAGDPCVQVALVATLVAFVPMLLVKETGPRAEDAALLKLGFAAGTVLMVFVMRAAVVELRDRLVSGSGSRLGWRVPWIGGLLGVLVVAGVVSYLETMAMPGRLIG
jgi:hypothetical protein